MIPWRLSNACLVQLHGYRVQHLYLLVGGGALMQIGVLRQLWLLIRHFDLGGWTLLALVGILAILIASVMESQNSLLRL